MSLALYEVIWEDLDYPLGDISEDEIRFLNEWFRSPSGDYYHVDRDTLDTVVNRWYHDQPRDYELPLGLIEFLRETLDDRHDEVLVFQLR